MKDLSMIPNNSVDCVYNCHVLEHVYFHQVKTCLEEWYRVIKSGGELRIVVPDLKSLAKNLDNGDILTPIYDSPGGEISPIDVIYGYRGFIAAGQEYMSHKTGFTKESFERILNSLGMEDYILEEKDINVVARIFKH
jgi:hypothetical protein